MKPENNITKSIRSITRTLPILLILLPPSTFAENRLKIAEHLWQDRLQAADGKAIVSEYYPTEEALPFLTAYRFTKNAKYAKQAAIQLEYAHTREQTNLFLTSASVTHRDYQARQIYNFYVAYRILGDDRYLRWADAGAEAMLKTIPRAAHEFNGETHKLFAATYIKPDGTPSQPIDFTIDVNQNAEVGLAFALLYHQKKSRWFHDPRAKEIAYEETLAGMSLQEMPGGKIPLREGEWIQGYDTAYGSYATFSWTWSQTLWHDPKFEPHVQAAGRWLAPKTNLAKSSDRWYPTRIEGGPVPYWEAWFRLPLLWYCHLEAHSFTEQLFDRMQHPEQTPNDKGITPEWWAHFDLMGIPRKIYLGN